MDRSASLGILEVRDYVAVRQLQHGYAVTEMQVESQGLKSRQRLSSRRNPSATTRSFRRHAAG